MCAVLVAASLVGGAGLALLLHRAGRDPDTDALPLLTSSVDVVGQLMLVLVYWIAAPRSDRTLSPLEPIVTSLSSAINATASM